MKIGYCSNKERKRELEDYSCDKIYFNPVEARRRVGKGDSFVFLSLHDLGLRMSELIKFFMRCIKYKIEFIAIHDKIRSTPEFNKMVKLLYSTEQKFLEVEHKTDSIYYFHRPGGSRRKLTTKKLKKALVMFDKGKKVKQIAKELGVAESTVYRWCPARDRYGRV